jgi:hypothetical protein
MNIIHLYCGEPTWAPHNVEILGDLKYTDIETFKVGYDLRVYQWGNEVRRVFTNSKLILDGVRQAIKESRLHNSQVILKYMVGDKTHDIKFSPTGNYVGEAKKLLQASFK